MLKVYVPLSFPRNSVSDGRLHRKQERQERLRFHKKRLAEKQDGQTNKTEIRKETKR